MYATVPPRVLIVVHDWSRDHTHNFFVAVGFRTCRSSFCTVLCVEPLLVRKKDETPQKTLVP